MKSHLVVPINGKEVHIPIQLTDEQLKHIGASVSKEKITGWEFPKEGETAYYQDAVARVQNVEVIDKNNLQIQMLYEHANCYSSELLAENIARGDLLIRELRRFSIQHCDIPIDFKGKGGYTITYNYQDHCLECGVTGNWKALGDIVFDTEEHARMAMNKYSKELIWYFTEMINTL